MEKYKGFSKAKKDLYGINKASILKRILSFITDAIIFIVLMTGFLYVASAITKYDDKYDSLQEKYVEYGILIADEEQESGYRACEYVFDNEGNVVEGDVCATAWQNFMNDEEAVRRSKICDNLMVAMLTTSSLLAILIIEFIIPLFIKHNKTIGYWAMHVGLLGSNGVVPSKVQLFARAVIGRWAIETVPPMLCICSWMVKGAGQLETILLIVFVLAEAACISLSKNNVCLHDLIANTVPVDCDTQYFANSLQELEEARKG